MVSRTDLGHCAQFQPNPISSFTGDASQTDRQSDAQTANMIFRHYQYLERDNKSNYLV